MKLTTTRKPTKKPLKRTVLIVSVVLVVLAGAYLAYGAITRNTWPFASNTPNTETTRGVNDVDYGPPTQEDIDQSQSAKERNADQPTTPNQNNQNSSKITVSVGVSFSDVIDSKLEIRSFVTGIIEGGGTCTAVLTKGNHRITRSSEAFIDSSSSVCSPMYIAVSDFPERGNWSLVINYDSGAANGSSGSIEVSF